MAASWATAVSANPLDVVDAEQFFNATPTVLPDKICHVQIKGNSGGTTDSLTVALYGTLDGTNYSTVPFSQFVLDCTDGADNVVDIIVKDIRQFRVGVTGGSTDTIAANMSYCLGSLV